MLKYTEEKDQGNSIQKQALSKKDFYTIFQIGFLHKSNYVSNSSILHLCFLATCTSRLLWFLKKHIKYSVCEMYHFDVCDASSSIKLSFLVSVFLHQTLEWLASSWLC